MLDDEKPPYIQNIPEDEDQEVYQSQMENIPQEQYKEEINSENEQIDNIPYQQPLIETANTYYTNDNPEDILKQSSLEDLNNNPYNQQSEAETQNLGIINNYPINENQSLQNNLDDNKIMSQSYSFSTFQNNNNPLIYSAEGQNNTLYSTANPIINQPIIVSGINQYDSTNNNIICSVPDNNIQNSDGTIIVSEYPKTLQENDQNIQNIYYSNPLSNNPKIINNFPNQNQINSIYYSRNPNNINNTIKYAQVVQIDDNLMKNPEVAKEMEAKRRKLEEEKRQKERVKEMIEADKIERRERFKYK